MLPEEDGAEYPAARERACNDSGGRLGEAERNGDLRRLGAFPILLCARGALGRQGATALGSASAMSVERVCART